MLLMSGNHRMSKGQFDSPLRDIWWYDAIGEIPVAWPAREPEQIKARILYLRSALYRIRELLDKLDGPEADEIRRIINDELNPPEWALILNVRTY